MVTKSITRKAPVAVQATDAKVVETAVTTSKPTAYERLVQVLVLIDRTTAKEVTAETEVKFGKAIGLLGGGSVYINRGNADVRSSTKQVADWAKAITPSAVRGPQGQYLRITF